ncbi:MAG: hypothetical protein COA99_16335 [Moraxellaceae bacterium]|nr:MAG: hypothetical protein COA99_16335 [Moraxellaceae bacterium]
MKLTVTKVAALIVTATSFTACSLSAPAVNPLTIKQPIAFDSNGNKLNSAPYTAVIKLQHDGKFAAYFEHPASTNQPTKYF